MVLNKTCNQGCNITCVTSSQSEGVVNEEYTLSLDGSKSSNKVASPAKRTDASKDHLSKHKRAVSNLLFMSRIEISVQSDSITRHKDAVMILLTV